MRWAGNKKFVSEKKHLKYEGRGKHMQNQVK